MKAMIAFCLIALALVLPGHSYAQAETRLYLENLPLPDEKLLVVTVMVADATDLYGAELRLSYDPTQLRVRDDNPRLEGIQIAPGPLLAAGDRFVAANQADPQRGLIDFVFTLLEPASFIEDEGTLATIIFEITGSGPFDIEITTAKLVSVDLEPVPVLTEGLHLNGDLESTAIAPPGEAPVVSQPQSPALPVGRWTLVGLLCLLIVGGIILFRSKRSTPSPGGKDQVSGRRIPGPHRSTTRSAALLTEQANLALSQSRLEKAYELFNRAIELNPTNVEAWLGKGLVAQQPTEKRICFQRVLAFDPDNSTAKLGLQQLEAES